MNTALQPMYEWNQTPWRKLERMVYKLQKRIYRASNRGDVKTVRRLQKLLMKSRSAKYLAVRRVTQDNQGKKTAGVDGVKSLTPKQRLKLVEEIKLGSKVSPTRRVWIPKPGREEKRPLGIPTMYDRALQALVKLALEPEWEARFEPNSYGFRPGRSCQDAVQAIFDAIRFKAKYVLDADIAKCFDRIDHKALLNKLNTFPTIRRQIRAWLKAGVMDNLQYFDTSEGTPQGSVISPLLANIALHGMEWRIKDYLGWANYYSKVSSKKVFSKLDALIYTKLKTWAKHRHRNKGEKWLANKYWKTIDGDNWVFATRDGNNSLRLIKHSSTKITDYAKVKSEASPYDGNLIYWSMKLGKSPQMPKRMALLLKEQKGECPHCGLYFKDGDVIELDHIIPKSKGGKDEYKNWQLLHRHCHDTKTVSDYSSGIKSGCNSAKPKPSSSWKWFWEEDMLAMRYV